MWAEGIVAGLGLMAVAGGGGYVLWRRRPLLPVKPGDGEIAPLAHIEEQIARFERDLADAVTQEETDVATGRLAYWLMERERA